MNYKELARIGLSKVRVVTDILILIIMYVFDNSYVSFFTKSLKEDAPIIFAYIPEIYNDSFISRFRKIENEHKHK